MSAAGDIYLLLRCGYRPENITGIDILPDRIEKARSLYPHIRFIVGDAGKMDLPPESYDLIFEFTMFVQITDNTLAKTIADEMLRVLKPGGYVLLIDWRMPKPGDKRYKALTRRRLESLFEIGRTCQIVATQKGALAPPIGRALSKYLPACYFAVASCLPFLVAQAAYLLKKA